MVLNSINYFRGAAILFIVAGHCLDMTFQQRNSLVAKFILNIMQGGTPFFVFISGFLFYHVFYEKFNYRNFMISKIKNVLFPYVVLSIMPVCYFVFIRKTGPYHEYIFSPGQGVYLEYLRPFCMYFLTGRTFVAYWYIPFIMVIFALSPVFVRYVKLPSYFRIILLLLCYCIAMIIHRPLDNISVLQSVVYFVPVYLLGITASMYKEQIYRYATGKEFYMLLSALLLVLIQVVFYETYANFHKNPFEVTVLDINIIQKSIFCLFLMVLLNRFENKSIPYLKKLAAASFAIYFLHPPVLLCMEKFVNYLSLHHYSLTEHVIVLGCLPIVLFISIELAILTKRTFRSYSRLVVGW